MLWIDKVMLAKAGENMRMKKNVVEKNKEGLKDIDFIHVKTCGVCGGHNFKILEKYADTPVINFVKCTKCGAVTYDKYLSTEKADEMYKHYTYFGDSEKDGDGCVTFCGYKRFAKHLFRQFMRAGGGWSWKDRIHILDFGGGDGSLSAAFAEYMIQKKLCHAVNIMVIDYCESLYVPHHKAVRLEHLKSLDQLENDRHYDVVITSAVFEHLPKPGAAMKKLFGTLKKDGVMYIRTPYKYPLRVGLAKIGIRYDLQYPEHIWDFGGYGWWKNLAENIGCRQMVLAVSQPSIVESSFRVRFGSALAAYVLKAPGYVMHKWPYVGGWETVYIKK